MTRDEYIRIEGNDEAREAERKYRIPSEWVLARWDYLWEKYKPSEAHMSGKRDYLKRKDEAYGRS